jgi:hypothetical protein
MKILCYRTDDGTQHILDIIWLIAYSVNGRPHHNSGSKFDSAIY